MAKSIRVLLKISHMLDEFRYRLLAVIRLLTIFIHHGLKVFEASQCEVYFLGHIFAKICLQNKRIH